MGRRGKLIRHGIVVALRVARAAPLQVVVPVVGWVAGLSREIRAVAAEEAGHHRPLRGVKGGAIADTASELDMDSIPDYASLAAAPCSLPHVLDPATTSDHFLTPSPPPTPLPRRPPHSTLHALPDLRRCVEAWSFCRRRWAAQASVRKTRRSLVHRVWRWGLAARGPGYPLGWWCVLRRHFTDGGPEVKQPSHNRPTLGAVGEDVARSSDGVVAVGWQQRAFGEGPTEVALAELVSGVVEAVGPERQRL